MFGKKKSCPQSTLAMLFWKIIVNNQIGSILQFCLHILSLKTFKNYHLNLWSNTEDWLRGNVPLQNGNYQKQTQESPYQLFCPKGTIPSFGYWTVFLSHSQSRVDTCVNGNPWKVEVLTMKIRCCFVYDRQIEAFQGNAILPAIGWNAFGCLSSKKIYSQFCASQFRKYVSDSRLHFFTKTVKDLHWEHETKVSQRSVTVQC